MTKVAIWALDGGVGSTITGAIDVFHVANMLWKSRYPDMDAALFQWRLSSISGLPIQTAGGSTIAVDGVIDPTTNVDIVLVPGIVATTLAEIQTAFDRNAFLIAALRTQHERGATIGANCASTFFLAEAGLLEDRTATTSWWLEDIFRSRYPNVKLCADEAVTEDDTVICSGASTACLHLALRLVEQFGNTALATAVAKNLLIDGVCTSQASFKTLTLHAYLKHNDTIVLRGQRWMERYLATPFQLSPLARYLRRSERTVIRRFKKVTGRTPGKYMREMQIDFAKRVLEAGQMSIDNICLRVGYEDVSYFRRLFRRETGVSPSQYQALAFQSASK